MHSEQNVGIGKEGIWGEYAYNRDSVWDIFYEELLDRLKTLASL